MIYLDYSANTPVDPAVLERFCQIEREQVGNPNSRHAAGRAANTLLEQSTASIAALLGVTTEEIIHTSCASESNNMAVKGIARTARHTGRHIISTALEHPSVSACLTVLQEQGYEIDLVDIGRDGRIDLDHLRDLLRRDTILVAVSAVDSELGTVQPVAEIAALLRDYPNCRLHLDATQAAGKIPLPLEGVDTMSFAPHKFYGMNGSGILFKRQGLGIEPLIHGGASASLYRSGTPALALAVACEKALSLALTQQEERIAQVREHNTVLRRMLAAYPKVRINSPEAAVPHILNLSVQGVRGSAFQAALDEEGICVSVKSACSVENSPSRAVYAVSRDRKNALSSWRISLSHWTTSAELQEFHAAFARCYDALTNPNG